MGAVNSVRKLTVDSLALLEQLEPNTAELVAKSAVRLRVQQLLQQKWPTCRVLPFGSSESGLGFGGCDVDLGIYFEDVDVDAQGQYLPQERINLLTSACEHLSGVYEVQQFVRNARVPVIKLWDPKQQVAFDVCVGGINALLNTAFLKHFGWMDPRVRPLVFAVKFWAKQRGINDSVNGMLSSYGYTLLLIFYLQSQHAEMQLPMALAHFYNLQSQKKLSVLLEGLQSFPAMDSPSTYGISEMESVGALLAGFFDFFAYRFNMEDEVVSIRMGKAVSKTTKWSHPSSWRLSIEDPFELAHDVGRVIFHRKGQEIIHSEFKRASTLLSKNYRLADICVPDHSSWNIVSSCYICCCKGHVTRRCGQLVRRHSSSVTSTFSDCWYCGDHGHYKAECPMLFFRSIPCLIKAADDYKILAKATSKPKCETISLSLVGIAKAPTSILIPVPSFPKAPWSKLPDAPLIEEEKTCAPQSLYVYVLFLAFVNVKVGTHRRIAD
ncbi:nucleotidyltransferase family protein isoform 1 [Plasmopara halstedii]|uniref:Nucleotidyltransferase family protein isoform 1 n=1 Tax=Plasmopara halstedii TaxID=4781 RepID=A0A0P1B1Y3_PLAHL|nr:nucleotidyltransferase family protein isoform 1 [Plasmopara halstedii]CEG47752.1 nucleotidyltransferase family protein isoform 1 [Plasmopara halstedii]|eukprot:XP_024584121.1 nucleotidyltransferase family protein isoform 1 [Plasmopara halstedii]